MTDWKKKLIAFLHDPPHKPFDIKGHEYNRGPLLRHLGLTEEDIRAWEKSSDWLAAAADRFPFPRANALRVDWLEDTDCEFRHPLGAGTLRPKTVPRPRSATGETWIEKALHGIETEEASWRAKFIRVWRLWPERSAREHHPLMAYLVADTRIPDHTLWHHNTLVSALETTRGEDGRLHPAFLLFQIGPVQDFIAQSRSMLDLWSGSYLLSFLISKALATVALEVGPDAIIFPNLRGVPLLDWWWSREPGLFPQDYFSIGRGRLHRNELLTPSLPNRFLALIPGGERGQTIAESAASAVKNLWQKITEAVHTAIRSQLATQEGNSNLADWDKHWNGQTARFPIIDRIIHEWQPENVALARVAATEPAPPLVGGWTNNPLHHAELWRGMIPQTDRESWHGNRNDAFVWPVHFAATDWKFAARKRCRPFEQCTRQFTGSAAPPKDHLNGRDEVLGGAAPDHFWNTLRSAYGGPSAGLFKGRQLYGAVTVVKRLWPQVFLQSEYESEFRPNFDSIPEIAGLDRSISLEPDEELQKTDPKYYAVICMDGDDMGQWLSGAKTPSLQTVLAEKAWKYFDSNWKPQTPTNLPADRVQRPLSPGYHAAFSEAVSNFSLYCTGQIVNAFKGQIIYSGGDDVLAMLPAETAVDCAYSLQCAFRGQLPDNAPSRVKQVMQRLFEFLSGGFMRCRNSGENEDLRPNWPLLVPGPVATASVGIAIGHVRSPMQETIQAARDAEATAKQVPRKGALSLRIQKRSGESTEFAARFDSDVLRVWAELEESCDSLSGRFPYRYLQLLKPLLIDCSQGGDRGWVKIWNRDLVESVKAELRYAHFQHDESGRSATDKRQKARSQAERWVGALVGQDHLSPALAPRSFIHFWMTWAFFRRLRKPDEATDN
jgi:CRISPR-associated protein Cmr2